jgi:L-lactate dehydrogenase (cytochrome)
MARKAASISDYRELARRRLPSFLFEYVDGGSYDEVTLRRNVQDLRDIALRQRVLCNVAQLDLTTTLLGQASRLPVALAPIGLAGMLVRRGEVQAARAARDFGVPYTLSTVSACSIEEVTRGAPEPYWFQLYMIRDRGFMRELIARAKAARCSALLFTVDMPVAGSRYRDYRSGLAGAAGMAGTLRRIGQAMLRPAWSLDVGVMGRPHQLGNVVPVLGRSSGLNDFFGWLGNNFDPAVTWRDLEWVRAEWQGPLVLKGVLDAEDARSAIKTGADGIVVSNHGGRQLDGVLSSARVLPDIVQAVGGHTTIFADGGIRSGLDVVRMLALGANGVMIGRAYAYALAARGHAGVTHVLQLIEAEMRVAMALTGVTSVAGITSDILAHRD